jgi:hypothetical protein
VLWPTGIEPEGLPPTIANDAAPEDIVAVEMLTAAVPVLVRLTLCAPVPPTATLPKLRLVELAESTPVPGFALAVEPAPDRVITSDEGVPFVVSVTVPLVVAVEPGVKITLKVTLPPGGITVEVEIPVMVNPVPDGVTCENVRGVLPVFWSVMVCELLVPLTTVPKLMLEGVAESCACVPIPESGIVSGESEASLVIVKLAVAALSDFGAN